MSRPSLEVADIFRGHGPAWRRANAGHVSLGQLKVMSAIERCRTAALGGHVARCEKCAYTQISYNSCLMGKSINGELANRYVGGSVDFGDLTLHYGQPLRPATSRPEVKGSFPLSTWPGSLNGFELLIGIHGAGRFRWSQVFLRPIHDDAQRRLCVAPKRDLPSIDLGAQPFVMESKRKADRRRTILKNARLAAEAGRQLPINGFAHKAANGRRPLPAATGIARSAKLRRQKTGLPHAKPICCRCLTITSCSRCRRPSPISPTRTRP